MPRSGRRGKGEGKKVPGRESMCQSPKAGTSLADSRGSKKGGEDEVEGLLPEKLLPSLTGQVPAEGQEPGGTGSPNFLQRGKPTGLNSQGALVSRLIIRG